ncbi:MAG: hypothetical protein IKP95_02175 [Ruminococcus sp.]|nr:hypothetical protein [Ruminococcus sp.]
MSKKDRLKKQSEAQLKKKRQSEAEELREREEVSESRAAKKLRKSARRRTSAVTTVIKVLMLIPFLWSGLYYGGIFVIGISMEQMDDVPARIAVFIGLGSLICLVGIVFAFLSKYITQFCIIAAGSIMFMWGASYIVDKAKERIGDGVGLTEEQKGLADKWRFGLYPILILTALSAALLAVYLIGRYREAKKRRREFDNRPVKSIIE